MDTNLLVKAYAATGLLGAQRRRTHLAAGFEEDPRMERLIAAQASAGGWPTLSASDRLALGYYKSRKQAAEERNHDRQDGYRR